jgi:SAM-dependent methyltransferase
MLSNEQTVTKETIRSAIADRYSAVGTAPSAEDEIPTGRLWAERLGYPLEVLDTVPARALASFTGIGTPILLAGLSPGERVLDLGCGAGLDSILAARLVAPHGQVDGVDLAPGMIAAARAAVAEALLDNVTIAEAAAENLPLASGSMDVAVVKT